MVECKAGKILKWGAIAYINIALHRLIRICLGDNDTVDFSYSFSRHVWLINFFLLLIVMLLL